MVLISIIITNYNYSKYLERCIESCLFQNDFRDFEVLMVDDGSTDNSLDVTKKYKKNGLRIILQKNGGIEKASNIGFEKAVGDFVVRVDADDYLSRNFLIDMKPHLDSELAFIYPDYYLVNESGAVMAEIGLPDFDKDEIMQRGDFLATGTVYCKKIIEAYGYYNTKVKNCGLENYELVIKMLNDGFIGKHIPTALFYYRRHGSNISNEKRESILTYGKELFLKTKTHHYGVNKYHPYMSDMEKNG